MASRIENKIPKGITFTPVFDHLITDIGLTKTAILGVIWRYSQMEEKVCRASQVKIAQKLGVSRNTVNSYLDELIEEEYIIDLTPGLRNRPHIYQLTQRLFTIPNQSNVFEVSRPTIESQILDTALSKETDSLSKEFHSLSIFEMFGVKNLYMKKDIKIQKKIETRNISNNKYVDILVYKGSREFTSHFKTIEIPSRGQTWDLIHLIHFGLGLNIHFFENNLASSLNLEVENETTRTIYRITEKGVDYLKSIFTGIYELIDMDLMSRILDFWFWYSLDGNDRVENLEQMLSIYKKNSLDFFEKRYPEVYRQSPEIQVVTKVIGKEPPIELLPRIYTSFPPILDPNDDYESLNRIFQEWINQGHEKNDFGWLFEWYKKVILIRIEKGDG